MSSEHLATVAKLTPAAPTFKLLMFALAYHADSHGRVNTSLGELIDTTGLSERSIRTWMKRADEAGHIIRMPTETYTLRLP